MKPNVSFWYFSMNLWFTFEVEAYRCLYMMFDILNHCSSMWLTWLSISVVDCCVCIWDLISQHCDFSPFFWHGEECFGGRKSSTKQFYSHFQVIGINYQDRRDIYRTCQCYGEQLRGEQVWAFFYTVSLVPTILDYSFFVSETIFQLSYISQVLSLL